MQKNDIVLNEERCYNVKKGEYMSYYDTFVEQKDFCYFVHRKGWVTPAHFHGSVEILFAEKGKQRVTINGETHTLEEGEACFCSPFAVHSYMPEDEVTSVFVFVIGKEYCNYFLKCIMEKRFQTFSVLMIINLCKVCMSYFLVIIMIY